MRMFLAPIVVLCGLLLTGLLGTDAKAWRIMVIGDSITEEGKDGGYRSRLLKKPTEAGYRVAFVGTRGSDPLRHAGYGGKNAEFLATVVGANFKTHPADIVLMHCGHNHFADEQPVPGILAATEKMIADLQETNPGVVVLPAEVIPSGKLPKYSYLPELNRELVALANRLDVMIVNQAAGFDWQTDTVADMVHPTAQGYDTMAAFFIRRLADGSGSRRHPRPGTCNPART